MKKLMFLFAVLLLVSVAGCSSSDSVTGPDTSEQVPTDDPDQKPATPNEPPGDPDTLGDNLDHPRGPQ